MTNLKAAVDEMVASLDELVAAIDAAPGALRPRMHSTLDTQMRGLRVLQEECAHGAPSRRSWSLGQASLPVVTSLVNAAAKPAVGVAAAEIERCRAGLAQLSAALLAHAEGRDLGS